MHHCMAAHVDSHHSAEAVYLFLHFKSSSSKAAHISDSVAVPQVDLAVTRRSELARLSAGQSRQATWALRGCWQSLCVLAEERLPAWCTRPAALWVSGWSSVQSPGIACWACACGRLFRSASVADTGSPLSHQDDAQLPAIDSSFPRSAHKLATCMQVCPRVKLDYRDVNFNTGQSN